MSQSIKEIRQRASAPQKAILKSTSAVNLFLGGVGAGKTHLGGIISWRYITMFPQCFGFIGANTHSQLSLSTLYRIREYWKSINVTEWSKDNPGGVYVVDKQPPSHFKRDLHNFRDYNGVISFVWGQILFIGSLENATAHEGKQFAWAILDETKDSREEDVKEVIVARLRQQGMCTQDGQIGHKGTDFNPLYILTSPAKTPWINEWFSLEDHIVDINAKIYNDGEFFMVKKGNKFAVISSTHHNQHNLPTNYIDNVRESNTDERFKALIYANPFSTTGGEFFPAFDRIRHVDNLKYDPDVSIHISFDQNTVPYNSASIWQIKEDNDTWLCDCIDEIALTNPRNSTEEVCEEFLMRYPRHKSGVFYYGDASGKNRSTMSKDFKHHYEVVNYKLRTVLNNASDRTLTKNPSVTLRRDFINKILEDKLPIRLRIDENCKYMIADMMYLKQGIDGKKDKQVVKDKETGERYQKYGHFADNMEYMLVSLFSNYFNG